MKIVKFNASYLHRYDFDSFFELPSNRKALESAEHFISSCAQTPSTLLIYGAIGNGKTHLAGATCSEFLRKFPTARIYVSGGLSTFGDIPDCDLFVIDSVDLLLRLFESDSFLESSTNIAAVIERCTRMGASLILTSAKNPLTMSKMARVLKTEYARIGLAHIGELSTNESALIHNHLHDQQRLPRTPELQTNGMSIRAIEAEIFRETVHAF